MKITKLPSGMYRAQPMIDGKRYSITKATQAEVRKEIESIRAGKKMQPEDMTLSAAIDIFIEERTPVLSPSTIAGYKAISKERFKLLMPRKILGITQRQWQSAISDESKIVSAKTVKNSWGLIAATLTYNGFDVPRVNLPQIIRKEHEWLEPEQIQTFLAAIKGKRVEIPALLALHGLRKSELLAVDWSKIDLSKETITVSGAMVKGDDKKFVLKKTNKNTTSNRIVPILIPRLKEVLTEADKTKPVIPYEPTSVYKAINSACEKAGLPKVGIHGLRHSAVSLAYSLGMNEMTCMRLFGYSDFQTMRKIYTHLAQRDLDKSTTAMRQFFVPKEKHVYKSKEKRTLRKGTGNVK